MKLQAILLLLLFSISAKSQPELYQPFCADRVEGINYIFSDSVEQKLYISGAFQHVDNLPIKDAAVWDGSKWDSLIFQIGLGGNNVKRLHSELYATGDYLKRRNNQNVWEIIGISNFVVLDVVEWNGYLLAVGSFDSINGIASKDLALFDGTTWIPFPKPMNVIPDDYISQVIVYKGDIFVTGYFFELTGQYKRIARFHNGEWMGLFENQTGGVAYFNSMEIYNNKLYVAGVFKKSNGFPGNAIFEWNGESFGDIGGGIPYGQKIWQLQSHNGRLYFVGEIVEISGLPCSVVGYIQDNTICRLDTFTELSQTFRLIDFFQDTMIVVGGWTAYTGDSIKGLGKYLGSYEPDSCVYFEPLSIPIQNSIGSNLKYSPNPVSTSFTFQSSAKLAILTDLYGKNMLEIILQKNRTEVDVSSLPAGLYFLKTDKGETAKVVVER